MSAVVRQSLDNYRQSRWISEIVNYKIGAAIRHLDPGPRLWHRAGSKRDDVRTSMGESERHSLAKRRSRPGDKYALAGKIREFHPLGMTTCC